jgi:hypothetical protein
VEGKKSPDIMFYFNEKPLYWPYKGYAEFAKYVNEHLRKFIHEYVARQNGGNGKKRRSIAKGKPKPQPEPGDAFHTEGRSERSDKASFGTA